MRSPTPPSSSTTASAFLGRTVQHWPVAELRIHPENARIFGTETDEDRDKLDADIRARGQQNPIVVCGKGCALPRGTIIRGHRRAASLRRLGIKDALVIEIDNLDEDAIRELLVSDNLASDCARRLTELQRFQLEEQCRAALGRRRGQRTDLEGAAAGDSDVLVAKQLGVGATKIRERRKVFTSPASPEVVQEAVKAGRMSIARAADIVRDIEKGRTTVSRVEEIFAASIATGSTSAKTGTKTPRQHAKRPAATGSMHATPRQQLEDAVSQFDAASMELRRATLRVADAGVARAYASFAASHDLDDAIAQAAIALKRSEAVNFVLQPTLGVATRARSLLAQLDADDAPTKSRSRSQS